jgi:hypothetical protein
LEYKNSVDAWCKLWQLPLSLTANLSQAFNNYIREGNETRCIGISYKYIGFPVGNDD